LGIELHLMLAQPSTRQFDESFDYHRRRQRRWQTGQAGQLAGEIGMILDMVAELLDKLVWQVQAFHDALFVMGIGKGKVQQFEHHLRCQKGAILQDFAGTFGTWLVLLEARAARFKEDRNFPQLFVLRVEEAQFSVNFQWVHDEFPAALFFRSLLNPGDQAVIRSAPDNGHARVSAAQKEYVGPRDLCPKSRAAALFQFQAGFPEDALQIGQTVDAHLSDDVRSMQFHGAMTDAELSSDGLA
jgi:hypothetical protein